MRAASSPAPPPEGFRRCSECDKNLPLADFSPSRRKHKVTSQCRACARTICSDYRAKNPEVVAKWRESQVTRRRRDWADTLVRGSRSSARTRGLSHSISKELLHRLWAEQGGRCKWLGVEMLDVVGERDPLQVSLDRIDPKRGYEPDNVALTTMLANLGRSTCSAGRFKEVVEILREVLMRRGPRPH